MHNMDDHVYNFGKTIKFRKFNKKTNYEIYYIYRYKRT